MKIDNAINQITRIQNKDVKPKRTKESGTAASAAVSDQVQLTGAASLLRELETTLSDVPAEDAGKVDSIRQAIADGRFVVDEEAVAEGMVQETIEQLSHHRPR